MLLTLPFRVSSGLREHSKAAVPLLPERRPNAKVMFLQVPQILCGQENHVVRSSLRLYLEALHCTFESLPACLRHEKLRLLERVNIFSPQQCSMQLKDHNSQTLYLPSELNSKHIYGL